MFFLYKINVHFLLFLFTSYLRIFSHTNKCSLKIKKGEKERNTNGLPLICIPNGDQIHNLGMCTDRELNT